MKKIMIVAGEPSGDINGGLLVSALKKMDPALEVCGIGGPRMEKAGMDLISGIEGLSVVGYTEVLRSIGRFRRVFELACWKMKTWKPEAVVLIDYPGFNMRLAGRARGMGIKVFYYVGPQVWAWGAGRVRRIAGTVDRMLVIFPFEKEFYEKHGVRAEYVGHPVLDRVSETAGKDGLPEEPGLSGQGPVVCFLPGSRPQEVKRHLPVMIKAGMLMKAASGNLRFIIGRADTIGEDFLRGISGRYPLEVKITDNAGCRAVQAADLVIASSGTATVESAYFRKPMVVIYKVSFPTWMLAKMLVRVDNIAMVNVLAGKRVAPEFVQFGARPGKVAREGLNLLNDADSRKNMIEGLTEVKKILGGPGASETAARLILEGA